MSPDQDTFGGEKIEAEIEKTIDQSNTTQQNKGERVRHAGGRQVFANHTNRIKERRITLETTFSEKNLQNCWHKHVRTGMRSQTFLDLHDWLDVHRNIGKRVKLLRNRILDGSYRPSAPSFIRVEKNNGITRRLAIPEPEDAIVLQAIVEAISGLVHQNKPSENAFYSRSHATVASKVGAQVFIDYIWFRQYRKFFGKLSEISTASNYLVVTDVANYFESVDLHRLRGVLSSLGNFDEGTLDFLFYVLEGFIWRPDYLPASNRGLPQINFDAPRLLGYCFLFEVDRYLEKHASGGFVRWMDDIDVAVNDKNEGRSIIQGMDDLLSTRGLKLNAAKTKILSASEAAKYLWIVENKKLDGYEGRIDAARSSDTKWTKLSNQVHGGLKRTLIGRRDGRWEKILKRYLGLCTLLGVVLEKEIMTQLLYDVPGIRDTLFRYFVKIGPQPDIFSIISNFVLSGGCVDDASEPVWQMAMG